MADVKKFIYEVVLADHDPRKAARNLCFEEYLAPKKRKSPSEILIEHLKSELHMNDTKRRS